MPDEAEARHDRAGDLDDVPSFEEIARLARAFWPARTLLTAVELDLFSQMGTRPLTATELAQRLETDERGTELLANALVGLGLLDHDAEGYTAADHSRRFLDRSSPEYRGHVLRLAAWWWDRWSELTDVVRSGQSVDGPPAEVLRDFTLAMHEGKPDAGDKLTEELDLHGVRRIIDLGCGPAAIAEALALALPEAQVVALDRAAVLEIARARLPAELLAGRVLLVDHDFLGDGIPLVGEPPGPYDMALLSSVVHLFDETENVRLLARIHDALAPGGRVVIRDFLVDDEGVGPADSALFALTMLVSTSAGRCYAYPQIKSWLHEAGFGEVTLGPFDGPVQLITARRA